MKPHRVNSLVLLHLTCLALLAGTLSPLNETSYSRQLAGLRGRVVVVDFWATWCDPCREELPKLVRMQKELGFTLVTVSADEPESAMDAEAFLAKSGFRGTAYIKKATNDESFINSVDPKWSGALPATFVYDKQGRRVKSVFGEDSLLELETAVRKLL